MSEETLAKTVARTEYSQKVDTGAWVWRVVEVETGRVIAGSDFGHMSKMGARFAARRWWRGADQWRTP